MATKQQAIKALHGMYPDAELTDDSTALTWGVIIEAPPAHHWDDGPHCFVLQWTAGSGKKSDFWSHVIEQMRGLRAVRCCDQHNACEFVSAGDDCEYWDY